MEKVKKINLVFINLFIFITIISFSPIVAYGTDADDMKNNAISASNKLGLYPSVMMAQMTLESGIGLDSSGGVTNLSTLSSPPNHNLFGIKGKYQGQSVSMPTLEDDGSGNMYSIVADFRKYPSWKESFEDNGDLLVSQPGNNPRVPSELKGESGKLYSCTWTKYAEKYQDATLCLTGTYATDTNYNNKLNSIITSRGYDELDGKVATDTGSKDDKKENNESKYVGDDAWKNRMINFKVNTYEGVTHGLETGSNGFVSNAVIMNMNKASQTSMEWAYIIMFSASIALFFFMFVTTIIYLVVLPNGLGGMKLMNAFEKTTGLSPTVNKQTTIDLISRLFLTVFLIACIYANLIPVFISSLIKIFQMILTFF